MATVKSRPDEPKTTTHGNATLRAVMTPDERAERAYQMRLQGHSWDTIALALGFRQRAGAYRAGMRHALKVYPVTPEMRARHKPRALEQLDQVWSVVEPMLASADEASRAKALEQAARLLELYAKWLECKPSETPAAAQLAAYGLAVIKE